MAYNFDGVNDNIKFGSDASIDNFVTQSMAAWIKRDVANVAQCLLCKQGAGGVDGWLLFALDNVSSNRLRFRSVWTTTGTWIGTTALSSTTSFYHVGVVYSNSATANDPTLYVNGVAEILTTDTNPTGTYTAEGAGEMIFGETGPAGGDYDGLLEYVNYANATWDASQMNRALWYGTPGGSIACHYPLLTDAVNRGTATANGTVTGAVVASLPRVERAWGSMMGCGR